MEKSLQCGHFSREESAVLADAVAAHRRSPMTRVQGQELERPGRGLSCTAPAGADPPDQARGAVGRAVPLVHSLEHLVALVHRDHRALGDEIQVRIRHDRRNLDDVVECRVKAGHLEVDPDEVVLNRHF